jgi:hypothetical protein
MRRTICDAVNGSCMAFPDRLRCHVSSVAVLTRLQAMGLLSPRCFARPVVCRIEQRPGVRCSASRAWEMIDAGISAGGSDFKPAEVVRPALVVARALLCVRKTAVGQAQQGSTVSIDQVNLDQT